MSTCWSEEPDLIERLQAEIARLRDELLTIQTRYERLEIHNIKLDAEIARLRAERDALFEGNGKLANTLGASNLRLRAALEVARDALQRDTGNYSFVLHTIEVALANEEG